MNLAEKQSVAAGMAEQFAAAELTVIVNYQGCKCAELTDLRRKLKPLGGRLKIVKNSLARRAVEGTSSADLAESFVGPTAVVWSKTDPVGPAKVLVDFAKEVEAFSIRAGVVGESVISAQEVESLASMPSREQLLAKLLALMNAPATRLLQTMSAPASSLVRLLAAWRDEVEKKG